MMVERSPWSHAVVVADLPPEGIEVELVPDVETRAALARNVGVLALPQLVGRFLIVPDGRGGAQVQGSLTGTARQTCVVTLEPFDNPIVERIDIRFAPAATVPSAARSVAVSEEDQPDLLVGGAFDLAAVATEFLSLAIDPYPRKPGAVFEPPAQAQRAAGESAFGALGKLKRPTGGRP
jgi:hypothetical protein